MYYINDQTWSLNVTQSPIKFKPITTYFLQIHTCNLLEILIVCARIRRCHCAGSYRQFTRSFISRALNRSLWMWPSIDVVNLWGQSIDKKRDHQSLSLSLSLTLSRFLFLSIYLSIYLSFSCSDPERCILTCGVSFRSFFLSRWESPRSPPTTIDRSITIDAVLRWRSRRTTISPWAASLRDCGRYFVSTRCERTITGECARAPVYSKCLANWPEFCLASWP